MSSVLVFHRMQSLRLQSVGTVTQPVSLPLDRDGPIMPHHAKLSQFMAKPSLYALATARV
jgi:hypothetical protein